MSTVNNKKYFISYTQNTLEQAQRWCLLSTQYIHYPSFTEEILFTNFP